MVEPNTVQEGQKQSCTGTPPIPSCPNLVLCFDGTGDWAGSDSTNVLKIFQYIEKGKRQLTYYEGGVGTLNDPGQMTMTGRTVMRVLDLGLATGLRDTVLNGYRFLIRNYRPGSQIYLFGFSRGAYTARVLASMIKEFGLLTPDNEHLVFYLWQTLTEFTVRDQFMATAAKLKADFSRSEEVAIHFMGLFDTVSSVGVLTRFKVFPSADGNDLMRHVRHAVSTDEQRNVFPECLFDPDPNKCPDLKEIWFPGVHRDIGGGYLPEQSELPNVPLLWIAGEAKKHCLLIDLDGLQELVNRQVKGQAGPGSLIDPYVLGGVYPMLMEDRRLRDADPNNPFSRYRYLWPNFKHIRQKPENALTYSDRNDDQPGTYTYKTPSPWPDLAGITLGCGMLVAAIDRWLVSLPKSVNRLPSLIHFADAKTAAEVVSIEARVVWWLAALFVAFQAINFRSRTPNKLLSPLGFVLAVLFFSLGSYEPLRSGLAIGVDFSLLSLLAFRKRPLPLEAVRVLPFVGLSWLVVAVAGKLIPWLCVHLPLRLWKVPYTTWQIHFFPDGLFAITFVAAAIALFHKPAELKVSHSVVPGKAKDHARALRKAHAQKGRWNWAVAAVFFLAWTLAAETHPDPAQISSRTWQAISLSTMVAVILILRDRFLRTSETT